MALMSPKIVGPISECSKVITAQGQFTGATVKIYANNQLIAQSIASSDNQSFFVNIPLIRDQKISCTQEKDGQVSAQSPTPEVVQRKPTSLSNLSFSSVLYECGMALSLEGTVSGTQVIVQSEGINIGHAYSAGPQVKVLLTTPLVLDQAITVFQSSCDITGPVTHSPRIEKRPDPLPSPNVISPIQQCQPSFGINSIIPGATVVLYKNGVEFGSAVFDVPGAWVEVNDHFFQQGDVITAKQFMCKKNFSSLLSNRVIVGPPKALPRPSLETPICAFSHIITATNLIPGSQVTVFSDGEEVVTCQTPFPAFGMVVPTLVEGARITIKQKFCNRESPESYEVKVKSGTVTDTNVLNAPLISCAARVRVENLPLGCGFIICSDQLGAISNYFVSYWPWMEIPVSPALIANDFISVRIFQCGGGELLSNKVRVQTGPMPLPQLVINEPVTAGVQFFIVTKVVRGAFIDVYLNNHLVKILFGEDERTQVNMLEVLKPGDSLRLAHRLCDQISVTKKETIVAWPSPRTPILVGPRNGETLISTSAQLDWKDPGWSNIYERVTSFDIFLDKSTVLDPATLLYHSDIGYDYVYTPDLVPHTGYRWKIIVKNGGGLTASLTSMFTTGSPIVPPHAVVAFFGAIYCSIDGVTIHDPENGIMTYAWVNILNSGGATATNFKIAWLLINDDTSQMISNATIIIPSIPPGLGQAPKFTIPGLPFGHYYIQVDLFNSGNQKIDTGVFPFPVS